MISLIFFLAVIVTFGFVLFIESGANDAKLHINNFGLMRWLSSGNWPAKVGALLLILGVGALLRYALINLDFPPQHKLISGFAIALVLGGASASLRNRPERRAIHLALAGAAFGVAYLTAYSAYGFFNYINDVSALSLLALVAAGAGFFAVGSNAMSIGILAMAGAYIAPAFAIGDPQPLSVYGYYLATSLVSAVMVSVRGWRALIHLSFLFTLAGALFFGWSGKFYQPQYFYIMQPMLLGLVLVHVFMPVILQSRQRSTWLVRFDTGYFLLLPVVAALLMLQISPDIHSDGALGLLGLAVIWTVAGLYLKLLKQDGVLLHILVAALFLVGALLCHMASIPWSLLGLAVCLTMLAAAPRLGWKKNGQDFLAGLILFFGLMHIAGSTMGPAPDLAFLNTFYGERLLAALMITASGWIARRRQSALAPILLIGGFGWAALATIDELTRLNIDFLPQVMYGLVLLGLVVLTSVSERFKIASFWLLLLTFATLIAGVWASPDAKSGFAFAYLILTPCVLLFCSRRISLSSSDNKMANAVTALMVSLPLLVLPWAMRSRIELEIDSEFFSANVVALSMVLVAVWAHRILPLGSESTTVVRTFHFRIAAFALAVVTLVHIERGIWPVLFELFTLLFLIITAIASARAEDKILPLRGAATVICCALVLEAMMLRLFGPELAVMTLADIHQMNLPGMVSLMWAVFGAGLSWWAMQVKSRTIWSAGAILLVLAAVKLVLFDFGSLGQLGNILAMIAAGLVFMGVAWFAPMPPVETKQKPTIEPKSTPSPAPDADNIKSVAHVPETGAAAPVSMPPQAKVSVAASVSRQRNDNSANTIWILWGALLVIAMFIYITFNSLVHHNAVRPKPAVHNMTLQGLAPTPQPQQLARVIQSPPSAAINPRPATGLNIIDACTTFKNKLPSDFLLLAGGDHDGRIANGRFYSRQYMLSVAQGERVDPQSSYQVNVDRSGSKVVLALSSYMPAKWTVTATPDTAIAGIIFSGHHHQELVNPSDKVPVLYSSFDDKGPCKAFYIEKNQPMERADLVLRQIFGRSASAYYLANNGVLDMSQ